MVYKLDLNISNKAAETIQSGAKFDDLVLYKSPKTANGREWTLATKSEADKDPARLATKIFAEGEEVAVILSMATNGKHLPSDFAPLGHNHTFKELGRLAGMETPEHKLLRESIHQKFTKAKKVLGVLTEGVTPLKTSGKPVRLVGLDYVLRELIAKESPLPVDAAEKLTRAWKEADTSLGFVDWQEAAKKEWNVAKKTNQTRSEFIPWVMNNEWEKREKKAWEKANPGQEFTEENFVKWKESQYDPQSLLPEPKWLLEIDLVKTNEDKKKAGSPEMTLSEFIKDTQEGRWKYWEEQINKGDGLFPFTKIDDAIFKKLDQKAFDYDQKSGSDLTFNIWIAKEFWLETNPIDRSDQAFIKHIDMQNYANDQKTNPHKMTFEEWKLDVDNKIEARWKASLSSMPLAEWKSQQVLNPLVPVPFVSLNAEQRKAYQTQCANGKLERTLIGNTGPFATTEESTAHSGKGWVIFVIGPKDDLYCGSHLLGVFHHSSFLGDRAVTAAGEIKTDHSGKITDISGKSGHYKPSKEENLAMLKWFEARGVNLNEVAFTCFLPEGESEPMNAKMYLDQKVTPTLKPKTH